LTIELRSGDWQAQLRPETGGAIAALRHRGVDVLRPMPEDAVSPLGSACVPLAPWCNRIRDGRFAFGGREVRLPANFPPEPHSLHGLSWQRPWSVAGRAEDECMLVDDYDGRGAWPWAYRAQQDVRVGPNGCAVTLTLTNRSDQAMPAGIGLHPYFRRHPETELAFTADHVLLTGADPLPTGISAPAGHFGDFAAGSPLPAETVDHCFAGWDGAALLRDGLGTIALSADGAPHLHLYAPADGSALCLEPVSHTPDAPNRAPAELILLEPGGSASLTLRIAAG
jgi:aldose 1-epimerase